MQKCRIDHTLSKSTRQRIIFLSYKVIENIYGSQYQLYYTHMKFKCIFAQGSCLFIFHWYCKAFISRKVYIGLDYSYWEKVIYIERFIDLQVEIMKT